MAHWAAARGTAGGLESVAGKSPSEKKGNGIPGRIEQYNLLVSFNRIIATPEQRQSGWSQDSTIYRPSPACKVEGKILYWVAAAAVIAAIGISSIFLYDHLTVKEIIISSGDKNKSILLPDSSFISLNKASSIKYKLNNEREMWLELECYFIVKKSASYNKHTPFIVLCGCNWISRCWEPLFPSLIPNVNV